MIGSTLGNRYEIRERIGGGGMAIVYRALDTVLNRYVSVKVLRPQFVTDPEFVQRFRREAQSAASLSHPNVVNIYDVGVEDETYYIVMEYINGRTLKELIQERAPLPISEAVDIAKQICSALQHAHEHQIVHRDIKPHNILMGKDGHVKVTDFGIARAVTSNTITHNGSVLGSVHYFSPEQARGGITDVKSDIYSLGVVLYEMVTGELPFSGESPISVALKHLQDHFIEPRQINPKVPQSVENIILKSLAKDPEVRYHSAKEMYLDLNESLQNPNVAKFVPPPDLSSTQATLQIPASAFQDQNTGISKSYPSRGTSEEEPSAKKKNLWKKIGIGVGILLLAFAGIAAGFTVMSNVLNVPTVDMPKVEGMTYDEAVKTLKDYGFKEKNIKKEELKDAGEANRPPMESGKVFAQDPDDGTQVKVSRTVTLKVSLGAETVLMPNLEGATEQEAKEKLAALHIDLSAVKFETRANNKMEKGKVFQQEPVPQVQIIQGQTKITLYLSGGPETAKVPDLTNLLLGDAVNQIQSSGFKTGTVVTEKSLTVPSGHVIRQSLNPGQDAAKDTPIDIWVSGGTPQDVKKSTYEVTVSPDSGKAMHVTIKRSDARGQQTVVDENVSSSKKYTIELYISPTSPGKIDVYENGELKETKTVPYS